VQSPQPPTCDVDFGHGVGVGRRGRGYVVCAGDTALHAGTPLAYGRSVSRGRYTCKSTKAGITCRNRRTSHGFFLSRQRYRLF
jgi:hypothetical protein